MLIPFVSDLSVIILQTYSRFIRGHALVHVFIHSQRVACTVCIYYSLLVSASLLGIGQRGGCSSRLFLQKLTRSASAYSCFILQVVYLHLGYFIYLDYHMCPIWTFTWGLLYVLEGPLKCAAWSLTEEAPKLSSNFLIVLLTFSERGIWRCQKACWLFTRDQASYVHPDLFVLLFELTIFLWHV